METRVWKLQLYDYQDKFLSEVLSTREEPFLVGRKEEYCQYDLEITQEMLQEGGLDSFEEADKFWEAISRVHFLIFYDHEQKRFLIADVSTNGTWIFGHRLPCVERDRLDPSATVPLLDEERIVLKRSIPDDGKLQFVIDPSAAVPLEDEDEIVLKDNRSGLQFIMKVKLLAEGTSPTREIQLLHHPLKQYLDKLASVFLLGPPGSGKTAFLNALRSNLSESQNQHGRWLIDHRFLLFSYIDFSEYPIDWWSDPTNLFRKLSDNLRLSVPDPKPLSAEAGSQHESPLTPEDDLRQSTLVLIKLIQECLYKRVVFLLDHFDKIDTPEAEGVWRQLTKLRNAASPMPLYVIAMQNKPQTESKAVTELRRLVKFEYWMPLLSDDEIRVIMEAYGLDPRSQQVKAKIVCLAGRRPRLSDLVAQFLPPLDTNQTDKNLAENLLAHTEVIKHCKKIWNALSLEEQKVFRDISKSIPKISPELRVSLADQKFLLTDRGKGLEFTSFLLQTYVEQLPSKELSIDIDKDRPGMVVNGKCLPLPPLEYKTFEVLWENKGRTVTHEQLIIYVYGYDADTDARRNIARLVKNIRKKIDEVAGQGAGKEIIRIVHGIGYRLEIP